MASDDPTSDLSSDLSLRPLVGHALLTALCPLIPVPFLDDWIRDVVRRKMVRRLLSESAVPASTEAAGSAGSPGSKVEVSDERVNILACGYDPVSPTGCFSGCLRKAFKIPVSFVFKLLFKKILRKIVFVLAIKDSVDTFSATFHEGFLLQHALSHEQVWRFYLSPQVDLQRVVELRHGIEAVRDVVDHRPVERWARKTFGASRRLLRQAAGAAFRQLRHSRRDGDLDEDAIYDQMRREEEVLEKVVDELTDEIGSEQTYLRDLRSRLDERLALDSKPVSTLEIVEPQPAEAEDSSEEPS